MKRGPYLDGEHCDVLVIGGGINGVAIARECARAGKRTRLVEQHDFAAGTTSRATRIIHGGLRYLEHGDIAQVRESLRERQRLLKQYSQLVTPLEFLLTLDGASRRNALAIRAGLWFYRWLGGEKSERNTSAEAAKLERLLDHGRSVSIFSFEDAQCEFPERLVAQWLSEAMDAGCTARNHTQVLEVERKTGKATGARLRDLLTGQEAQVEATWVVNASGPWADRVCESSGIATGRPMVGGVRGSHIVLERFPGAPEAAIYTEGLDRRPIFVVPWNGQMLVGTTEVPDEGDPARVRPAAEEIQYLLKSLEHLFPRLPVSVADIHFAFAGVRPLPYSPGKNAGAVSRRHYLHDHAEDGAAGLISVIGGKLTTAASLARECATRLGCDISSPEGVAVLPEAPLEMALVRAVAKIAEAGGIGEDSAKGIVEWFGPKAHFITQLASGQAEMRRPLCKHTSHLVAEAAYAYEHECAASLADILLRRVPVALGACWNHECSREAAKNIGAALQWTSSQTAMELEKFEAERSNFLFQMGTAAAYR